MTPLRRVVSQLGLSSHDQDRLGRENQSVVISGVPGSGKTSLLAGRVAQALSRGMHVSRDVLCLGGDASSASVLQEAVAGAASIPASGIHAVSVRAFVEQLLRRIAPRFGWPSAFSIYGDDERVALLRILAQSEHLDDLDIERFSRRIATCLHAEPDATLPESLASKGAREEEVQLAIQYERHMRWARAIDEAGLGQAVRRAIEDQPFEERWPIVAIDDAQHVTPALFSGLQPLLSSRVFTMAVCRATRLRPPGAEGWDVATTAERDLECTTVHLSSIKRGTPGIQSVVRSSIDEEAEPGADGTNPPILLAALSARDERRWIADRVSAHLDDGTSPDRCAVLCTDASVLRAVTEGLEEAEIPYQELKTPSIAGPPALLIDYLRAIANPHDPVALFKIMNEPARGIGQATKKNLVGEAVTAGCSVWERIRPGGSPLKLPGGRGPYVNRFAEQMAEWRRMAPTLTGPELVRRLTEDLDLTEERVKSYTAETLARHEALQGLTKALAGYPATPRALRDRIGAFIAANDVGTGVVVRRIEDTTGRQFECVVVAGAEEGLLPRRAERRQAARLRNERRRFILGLTRAERQLIVSWAKQRQAVDTEPRRQSRFLQSYKALMTDEIAPDDHGDDSYEGVDPHYYRRDLRAQQAGDAPEPSPTDEDMSGIDAGQRVRHSSYGKGVVQSVEVMENRRIAVIDFQEGGEKKVNLKYARLDVIDE